ncbi:MAG: hypothetical protein ABR975_10290 [Vulcanimicrobiaceae bacterium]|jgi:hypothetical protein
MLAPLLLAAVLLADDATPPPTALGRRGFDVPLATAVRAISFRPFLPDRPPTDVALLTPFHGESISRNEGVGLEYERDGRAWILSEWPQNGGTLNAFQPLPAVPGCHDVHAVSGRIQPRGVVWTTPHGLVLSLTPDGVASPSVIEAEFRRLVGLGACR